MRKKWIGAAIFDLLEKEIAEFVPDCQMSAERLCLVDLGVMETKDHRKGTLSLSIKPFTVCRSTRVAERDQARGLRAGCYAARDVPRRNRLRRHNYARLRAPAGAIVDHSLVSSG